MNKTPLLNWLLFSLSFIMLLSCTISKKKKLEAYRHLSRPEKIWTITHPFVLNKAYSISNAALEEAKKVQMEQLLDQEINGGRLDAFRHSYWMALLAQHIGPGKAKRLGIAHEKGNRIDFDKHRHEEGQLPDSISTTMDLFNNNIGIMIGRQNKNFNDSMLKMSIIMEINKGRMKIIAKNKEGNFVNCQGEAIPDASLKGKWNNTKCLVNSNYISR